MRLSLLFEKLEPLLRLPRIEDLLCRDIRSPQTSTPLTKPSPIQKNPEEAFFEKYSSMAINTQAMTGIPASVTLAQAALESGWGKHAYGNNFFGIKGKGTAGSQLLWTKEFRQGELVRVRASFRKYHHPIDSFLDHARVISTGRYLKHAMQHTDSALSFVTALQSKKAKYATDPHYTEKIMNIISRYQLEKYDLRRSQNVPAL